MVVWMVWVVMVVSVVFVVVVVVVVELVVFGKVQDIVTAHPPLIIKISHILHFYRFGFYYKLVWFSKAEEGVSQS